MPCMFQAFIIRPGFFFPIWCRSAKGGPPVFIALTGARPQTQPRAFLKPAICTTERLILFHRSSICQFLASRGRPCNPVLLFTHGGSLCPSECGCSEPKALDDPLRSVQCEECGGDARDPILHPRAHLPRRALAERVQRGNLGQKSLRIAGSRKASLDKCQKEQTT